MAFTTVTNVIFVTIGGTNYRLDHYRPSIRVIGGTPIIVACHPGGWSSGDRGDVSNFNTLANYGWWVICPDYPLASVGNPSYPLALEAVLEAVRWARRNAATFDADPNRVVLSGTSAGSHLAQLAASYDELEYGDIPSDLPPPRGRPKGDVSSRVQGVFGFSGRVKMTETDGTAVSAVQDFLGGLPGALPDRYLSAGTYYQMKKDYPPTFFAHGTADAVVDYEDAKLFQQALAREGIPYKHLKLTGLGHSFSPVSQSYDGETRNFVREASDWLLALLAQGNSLANAIKTTTNLLAGSTSVAAGATATSATLDMRTHVTSQINVSVTTTTGPSAGPTITVEISPDDINFYTYVQVTGPTTGSVTTSWSFTLPDATLYSRVKVKNNDGASVAITCRADSQQITGFQ